HQERDYPGRVIATDLRNPDFAAYALAFGGYGAVVEKSVDFPAAFAAARASGKPSIIHLKIDAEAITPTATLTEIREKSLAAGGASAGPHRSNHNLSPCPPGGRHPHFPPAGSLPRGRKSAFIRCMPYRRTENVARRLAEREQTILGAAKSIAGEGGMGAVQIAAVAQRADIAAGTIYRYFPSKNDLLAEVITAATGCELAAMRPAGDAAPGPLSPLAACIATFAARALQERRLAWAVTAEPIDPDIDTLRLDFRRALATELETRIRTAIAKSHLPEQDAR